MRNIVSTVTFKQSKQGRMSSFFNTRRRSRVEMALEVDPGPAGITICDYNLNGMEKNADTKLDRLALYTAGTEAHLSRTGYTTVF